MPTKPKPTPSLLPPRLRGLPIEKSSSPRTLNWLMSERKMNREAGLQLAQEFGEKMPGFFLGHFGIGLYPSQRTAMVLPHLVRAAIQFAIDMEPSDLAEEARKIEETASKAATYHAAVKAGKKRNAAVLKFWRDFAKSDILKQCPPIDFLDGTLTLSVYDGISIAACRCREETIKRVVGERFQVPVMEVRYLHRPNWDIAA